ncbi:hypothetical protein RJ640_019421 [Escallonia rubra]|uniref:Major facilitator superfamily (MFS) profile domain-containing protein n=1 Tax=Escallonia rubra TaxID=112253 RepID=A0AA88U9P0_9ASTE|nr:hypothetical protein RJ640_019421 [Escallonia rubra]
MVPQQGKVAIKIDPWPEGSCSTHLLRSASPVLSTTSHGRHLPFRRIFSAPGRLEHALVSHREVANKIDPEPEGSCSTHPLRPASPVQSTASHGRQLPFKHNSSAPGRLECALGSQGKVAITIDPELEGSCSTHPLRPASPVQSSASHGRQLPFRRTFSALGRLERALVSQDPSPSITLATGASPSGSSTICESDIERSSDHPSRDSTSSRLHYVAKLHVMLYWLMASLGGQLIGYSLTITAASISGGILGLNSYLAELSHDQHLAKVKAKENNFCVQYDVLIIFIISVVPLSALLSTLVANKSCFWWGRKPVLCIGSLLLIPGYALALSCVQIRCLIGGLVLVGCGTGFLHQVIPVILSEIFRQEVGRAEMVHLSMITLGEIMALVANLIASYYPMSGWKWSFGAPLIPCSMLVVVSSVLSETPKGLLHRHENAKALEILKRLRGVTDAKNEFQEICTEVENHKDAEPLQGILHIHSRPKLVISTIAGVSLKLLRIGSLVFFGPLVLKSLQFEVQAPIFFMYATIALLVGCFIGICIPETRGIPEENLTRLVWGEHWLWKRYKLDPPAL